MKDSGEPVFQPSVEATTFRTRVQTVTSTLASSVHFNIILLSTPDSQRRVVPTLRLPHTEYMLHSFAFYTSRPFIYPLFDRPNNICSRANIIKLNIMYFSHSLLILCSLIIFFNIVFFCTFSLDEI
jgi:hypothetical protein